MRLSLVENRSLSIDIWQQEDDGMWAAWVYESLPGPSWLSYEVAPSDLADVLQEAKMAARQLIDVDLELGHWFVDDETQTEEERQANKINAFSCDFGAHDPINWDEHEVDENAEFDACVYRTFEPRGTSEVHTQTHEDRKSVV